MDSRAPSRSPINDVKGKKNSRENNKFPTHNRLKSQWSQFLSNKGSGTTSERPTGSKSAISYNNKSNPIDTFSDIRNHLNSQKEGRLK